MELRSDEDGWICSRRSGVMLHKKYIYGNLVKVRERNKCEERIRARGWSRWD